MKKTYTVGYKRKRQGKTNYNKRRKLTLSNKPRLVVRRSNKNVIVQIIQYNPDGDKVLSTATTKEIQRLGWKTARRNTPAAYLTGLLCGKKANVKEAILDIGLNEPIKGSIIYAALKGVIDAGIKVPHSKEIFPSEDRIKGKHIELQIKKQNEIAQIFEEIKSKILK